ncbi:MAG: hypothetical protein ACTSX1_06615 [Candidatus Heimdallarchaeaceae archaeon]
MRDPKRIKPMLDMIKTIWVRAPDLRLLQLLLNSLPSDNMAYYIEDDELEKALKFSYFNQPEEDSN